jgi:hypothetical protein
MGPGALAVSGGGGLVRVYASRGAAGAVTAVVIHLSLRLRLPATVILLLGT